MKLWIILAGLTIICSSCTHSPQPMQTRILYNAGNQQVITSFANRRQHIMATLYGNQAALNAAINNNKRHMPGEVFTLVTWQQANNKYWYGSYINGNILSIETVKVAYSGNGEAMPNYTLVRGKAPVNVNGSVMNAQARINFIFARQPSVFP